MLLGRFAGETAAVASLMLSQTAMPPSERKRPWYLVLALLAGLAFGANGARSGWSIVARYREPVDFSRAGEDVVDEGDRTAVVTRIEAYVHAFDAAKSRGWPLGIATLLLGAATLFFAMRAMGGSGTARTALVQLVLAQAAVNGASHWLLRDVEDAELRMNEAIEAAEIHQSIPEKPRADETAQAVSKLLRAATPIVMAFETLGSLLIVVGLTRRRSRDFFDPASPAIGER